MRETTDVRVKALQDAIDALAPAANAIGGHFAEAVAKIEKLRDEAALEPAPKPAGGEWTVAAGANSHFLDMQILRDGECVALANEPEASAIAAAMNSAPTPPAADAQDVGELVAAAERVLAWVNSIAGDNHDKEAAAEEEHSVNDLMFQIAAYKRSATDGQS